MHDSKTPMLTQHIVLWRRAEVQGLAGDVHTLSESLTLPYFSMLEQLMVTGWPEDSAGRDEHRSDCLSKRFAILR